MAIAPTLRVLATGLLMFVAIFCFVHFTYILALVFTFHEKTHVPYRLIAAIDCLLAVLAFFASIYLCKRWGIRFWHRLSIASLLALMAAVSMAMVLVSRPPKMMSREIVQEGRVVEYHFSEPGLGSKSSGWRIQKRIDRPLDELDKLAEREVYLFYYWWGDDAVAGESFVISVLVLLSLYCPSIPRLLRSKKQE